MVATSPDQGVSNPDNSTVKVSVELREGVQAIEHAGSTWYAIVKTENEFGAAQDETVYEQINRLRKRLVGDNQSQTAEELIEAVNHLDAATGQLRKLEGRQAEA